MKKLILALALAATLTACGNANQQSSATEAYTTDAQAATDDVPASGFVLTDTGVGPIVLGMKGSDIPASVEGLYDRTANEMAGDSDIITCYLNGNSVITAELEEDGNVCGISVSSEAPVEIKTSTGEAYINK